MRKRTPVLPVSGWVRVRTCVLVSVSSHNEQESTATENPVRMLGSAERTMRSPGYSVSMSGCRCVCVLENVL